MKHRHADGRLVVRRKRRHAVRLARTLRAHGHRSVRVHRMRRSRVWLVLYREPDYSKRDAVWAST